MNVTMKLKPLHTLLLTMTIALMLGSGAQAQTNIDSFNFNELTTTPATGGQVGPYTNTGDVKAGTLTTGGVTAPANVTAFAGTAVNARPNDQPGAALAIQNGASGANNGSYLQLMTSTVGFSNLAITYATQRTSTGFSTQTLSYSTDAGTSFTTFGSVTPPAAFAPQTFDLSSITALNNNANVVFRLTFTGGSTTATTGNNRIDNFQLSTTPAPPGLASLLIGVCVSGWKARRRKRQAAEDVTADAAA